MGGRPSRATAAPHALDPTNLTVDIPSSTTTTSPQAWSGPPLPNRYLSSTAATAPHSAEDEVTEWKTDLLNEPQDGDGGERKEAGKAAGALSELASRYKAEEEKSAGHHVKKKSAIIPLKAAVAVTKPAVAATAQQPPGAVAEDDEGLDDSAVSDRHGAALLS